MASNKKISELAPASNLDGTELFPIAKSGLNFKATIAQIKNFLGLASTVQDGLMGRDDRVKLDAIATGATKNASDAELRDRGTHTGTQDASTITGLSQVATGGAYADLTGKPDLTPSGLGCAPVSHVGAGGGAHPLASDTTAGFMGPAHIVKLNGLKDVASTGLFSDLLSPPRQGLLNTGFHWNPNSNTTSGQALNDWSTIGTSSYVQLASSGADFASHSQYHEFLSAVGTYIASGLRSAKPPVKRGNHAVVGGFCFEAIVGPKVYVAGSVGVFGLFANSSKAYGNFSGTDIGVGIGWNADDTADTPITLRWGDGTTVTAVQAPSGRIGDAHPYYVKIECVPAGTAISVTVVDMETGTVLFDNYQITTNLLPVDTPLYSLAQMGTLANATDPVCVRVWAMSCVSFPRWMFPA